MARTFGPAYEAEADEKRLGAQMKKIRDVMLSAEELGIWHTLEEIERLKDEDKPMEIERARAVSEVAQTIINSAKVELRAMELAGTETGSEFLEIQEGGADRFLPERVHKGLSTGKNLGARIA